ncbi:MAG: hypothetical protein EA398_15030 [Deltaproteobacteria bacterium]|nr:MAG: hypothetical protein EA398_15030 [Deltaproteobacteria bacterium]
MHRVSGSGLRLGADGARPDGARPDGARPDGARPDGVGPAFRRRFVPDSAPMTAGGRRATGEPTGVCDGEGFLNSAPMTAGGRVPDDHAPVEGGAVPDSAPMTAGGRGRGWGRTPAWCGDSCAFARARPMRQGSPVSSRYE